MNFFKVFEDRIAQLFGTTSQTVAPFSFKKLAREAVAQLKKETYEIDEQPVAPGLFTILISPAAERQIKPIYRNLTKEIRLFLEAQADHKNIRFLAQPLVRFIPDQELKRSKFFVFAENVDAPTLDKVRAEEVAWLAEQHIPGAAINTPRPSQARGEESKAARPEPRPERTPQSNAHAAPAVSSTALVGGRVPRAHKLSEHSMHSEAAPRTTAPRTARRHAAHEPAAEALLIDRASGRTYPVLAPSTLIGRESIRGGVALQDVNVSRRHAEIAYERGGWVIADLNSTNGTLVNNTDITESALKDGDLITVGLTNLEFREG